ncbi:MAG: class I SAM-dependent methyltransferase [Patescibacteria group bacterium]
MLKNKILATEKKRLSKIGSRFSMRAGFNGRLEKYRILAIKDNLKNGEILDVGCADGVMAQALAPHFKHITAIDGSAELIAKARKLKLKNVDFICTLFEEFKPKEKFDSVILSDILEHVSNPVALLRLARHWLKADGRVVLLCPNANSIHRQIGVLAGLIKDVHDLNFTDKKVGHRRVYDIARLKKDIAKAGLRVKKVGGMFFKPLANDQMDELDDSVVEAFYQIGKSLPPDYLTEIYVQCGK